MTTVALVHDTIATRGGAERVVVALSQMFPDAPIHTLVHERDASFDVLLDRRVETSMLDKSAWLRSNHRHTVGLAPLVYWSRRIDADITICSSAGLSHHARTSGKKIVYCHTPARWLHDTDNYLRGFPKRVRLGVRAMAPAFRAIDRIAMRTADHVVANSTQTETEIADLYGVEATVVHPCSTLDLHGPTEAIPGIIPGFVLTPSRPLGYKRLDVLAGAARLLPDVRFVHIGDGPHRASVSADAPPNLVSIGAVPDSRLRWAYRNATAVALTCAEDFGLVPLEAAAHGVHTVAPLARGIVDHDDTMMTTYTFGDAAQLAAALRAAPGPTGTLAAERLGYERFRSEMQAVVHRCRR